MMNITLKCTISNKKEGYSKIILKFWIQRIRFSMHLFYIKYEYFLLKCELICLNIFRRRYLSNWDK